MWSYEVSERGGLSRGLSPRTSRASHLVVVGGGYEVCSVCVLLRTEASRCSLTSPQFRHVAVTSPRTAYWAALYLRKTRPCLRMPSRDPQRRQRQSEAGVSFCKVIWVSDEVSLLSDDQSPDREPDRSPKGARREPDLDGLAALVAAGVDRGRYGAGHAPRLSRCNSTGMLLVSLA